MAPLRRPLFGLAGVFAGTVRARYPLNHRVAA
jgi:hypothetical protein